MYFFLRNKKNVANFEQPPCKLLTLFTEITIPWSFSIVYINGLHKVGHIYLVERPQPTMNTLGSWSGHPQAPPRSRPAECHQL